MFTLMCSRSLTEISKKNEIAQAERKAQYDQLNSQYEPIKEEFDRKTKEMHKTSELVQALTTGVSAQEGQENGYMEQLQGEREEAHNGLGLKKARCLIIIPLTYRCKEHGQSCIDDRRASSPQDQTFRKGS